MKYFIYTRKSTESEDRQVMSLESQFSELKEFAAKEKLEIVLSAPVQGEAGRRGGGETPPPPPPVSSVRIFSNRHRPFTPSLVYGIFLLYNPPTIPGSRAFLWAFGIIANKWTKQN